MEKYLNIIYQLIIMKKNVLAVAGIISTVVGVVVAIPTFLSGNIIGGVIGTLLVVGGLVLLAVALE